MTNPVWPPSLPQNPLVSGYAEQIIDAQIRTPMEAGPAKSRPRFTRPFTSITCGVLLTVDQKATLDVFYAATVANGSLPFDWLDPISQNAATFRFLAEPTIAATSPIHFTVTLKLLKLLG